MLVGRKHRRSQSSVNSHRSVSSDTSVRSESTLVLDSIGHWSDRCNMVNIHHRPGKIPLSHWRSLRLNYRWGFELEQGLRREPEGQRQWTDCPLSIVDMNRFRISPSERRVGGNFEWDDDVCVWAHTYIFFFLLSYTKSRARYERVKQRQTCWRKMFELSLIWLSPKEKMK